MTLYFTSNPISYSSSFRGLYTFCKNFRYLQALAANSCQNKDNERKVRHSFLSSECCHRPRKTMVRSRSRRQFWMEKSKNIMTTIQEIKQYSEGHGSITTELNLCTPLLMLLNWWVKSSSGDILNFEYLYHVLAETSEVLQELTSIQLSMHIWDECSTALAPLQSGPSHWFEVFLPPNRN